MTTYTLETLKGMKMVALTNSNRKNAIATNGDETDNIINAAQEDAGFEKILKFKKGGYFIGEEQIPLGREYIAHTRAWTKCWIKFVDGEVADRKLYRVALGEEPLEREELDDLDQANWSEGIDCKPADPWVFQHLLPLEHPSSGEVVVFVTPSTGGRIAVAELCNAYAKRAKRIENCGQPIIKLATTTFPSKKLKTKVPRPLFEIVCWDEPSSDSEALLSASSKDEFGDEIPF
jgi:hypothetical protein